MDLRHYTIIYIERIEKQHQMQVLVVGFTHRKSARAVKGYSDQPC